MASDRFDWWNDNTPKDKVLVGLIELARKLAHLPQDEDFSELEKGYYVNQSTYLFGSLEKALKETAKLLYGYEMLTAPDALLPNECNLPEAEQQEIIEKRQQYYQDFLEKLDRLKTLPLVRREQQVEKERRRHLERSKAAVYTVREIPIQTRKEMLAQQSMEKTSTPSTQCSDEAALLNGRQTSRVDINPPKHERSGQMNTPRFTKERLLSALDQMQQDLGVIPDNAAIADYASSHSELNIPTKITLRKHLGPKDTWMAQLEEYRRAQRGDEPVQEDAKEALEHQYPAEGDNDESPTAEDMSSAQQTQKIKLNLCGLTLKVCLNGQEYQIEVDFGRPGD